MALINCPDCNFEVSSRANACPQCACPISDLVQRSRAPRVQTVEQTSKNLKGGYALSIFIGLVFVVFAVGFYEIPPLCGLFVFLSIGSFVMSFIIKYLIWWNHG